MKRLLSIMFIVAASSSLSGCLSDYLTIDLGIGKKDDRTISRYIDDKQYGRAIRALEKRVASDPSPRNKMKLAEARNMAKNYETRIIGKAHTKLKRGKWQSAFVVVDEALQHYPESRRLNRYREKLARRQTKVIKNAQISLIAAKADYLLRVAPIYEKLSKLDPSDSDIKWKLKKTTLQINEIAKSLSISGNHAIRQKDFETAQRYLELADQLNPTAENTRLLARLAQVRHARLEAKRRRLAAIQRAKARRPLNKNQQAQRVKLKKLTRRIRIAMRRGNYSLASKLLIESNEITHDHPEIGKLRLALDNSISKKVSQLVHRGNELYSKGRIEQARRSWKKALLLDPKNSRVRSSVERAERVLSKLREIKQKKLN